MKWWAWYADGTVYNSSEHEWDSLPQQGLVYVLELTPEGYATGWNGGDVYFRRDGIMGNTNDREGILRQFCPFVKFGQWLDTDSFNRVCAEANAVKAKFRQQLEES